MPRAVLDRRLLGQFLAVADRGSVRAGAAALNMSQPPLTQAIRRLEDGLGTALFERRPKGMVLTASGHVLAAEARALLARFERAEAKVRAVSDAAAPLRIGFVSAALNGVLTQVVEACRALSPEEPVLQELTTPEQVAALSRGTLDLGLLHPPVEVDDLEVRQLLRDPFWAAVPTSHPLAGQATVTFRDIAKGPLVLFPEAQGPSLMAAIRRLAFEVGADLTIAATAARTHTQLALVASGIGIGLVTRATARTLTFENVTVVPIEETRERLFLDLALVGEAQSVAAVADRLKGLQETQQRGPILGA